MAISFWNARHVTLWIMKTPTSLYYRNTTVEYHLYANCCPEVSEASQWLVLQGTKRTLSLSVRHLSPFYSTTVWQRLDRY